MCDCVQAEFEEEAQPSASKKAKAARAPPQPKRRANRKQPGASAKDKENILPVTPFTLEILDTGSLRKPSASQRSERECAVDLWGGASRTMHVFNLFDQQRERYEQTIADEQRKHDAAVDRARRDASHYQNKLSLWTVLKD